MKYLVYLLFNALCSCTVDEIVPDCKHSIDIVQHEREDILKIQIDSELDSVYITVNNYPRKKVVKHYYKCISYHIPKDETYIKIEAEQTCEYIY